MYTTTTSSSPATSNPFAALAMLDRLINNNNNNNSNNNGKSGSSKSAKRRRNPSKLSASSSSLATTASSSSDSLEEDKQQLLLLQRQTSINSTISTVLKQPQRVGTLLKRRFGHGQMLGPEIPSPVKEEDSNNRFVGKDDRSMTNQRQSNDIHQQQPCVKQGETCPTPKEHDELEEAPLFVLFTTYLGYLVLIMFGHVRDFFGKILKRSQYSHLKAAKGYAPLTSDFESFYTRRLYTRIRDCWNRPITGVPGRTLTLLERTSDDFNKTFR